MGVIPDWSAGGSAAGMCNRTAFFATYGAFLAGIVRPGGRYAIYPDGFGASEAASWQVVRGAVRRACASGAHVRIAPWRCFKGSDVLQLTDILLGTLTGASPAEGKVEVRDLLNANRDRRTVDGEPKILLFGVSAGSVDTVTRGK